MHGLGVGTVYRRFPSKEELIEALFEQAVQEVVALAEKAEAMEDSWAGWSGSSNMPPRCRPTISVYAT